MLCAVEYALKVVRVPSKRASPMILDVAGTELSATLSVQDGASHTARFDIDYAGEDMQVGLNPNYLRDALKYAGESCEIRLISPLRPALFVSRERAARFSLVMPMRLPD
jgi:DNA polymerase III sliding clamp (beta) subunit (PCNA family)